MNSPAIILFDGRCNLCAGVVRFILPRDKHAHFRFASLQSAAATRACAECGFTLECEIAPTTLIVLAQGRMLRASDAALAIARQLPFPWCVAIVFRVVPRSIRDALYYFIARRRYRWLGTSEQCLVPTESMRARFLE